METNICSLKPEAEVLAKEIAKGLALRFLQKNQYLSYDLCDEIIVDGVGFDEQQRAVFYDIGGRITDYLNDGILNRVYLSTPVCLAHFLSSEETYDSCIENNVTSIEEMESLIRKYFGRICVIEGDVDGDKPDDYYEYYGKYWDELLETYEQTYGKK